jgi:uncharacterized iron-regulated membrane protein
MTPPPRRKGYQQRRTAPLSGARKQQRRRQGVALNTALVVSVIGALAVFLGAPPWIITILVAAGVGFVLWWMRGPGRQPHPDDVDPDSAP